MPPHTTVPMWASLRAPYYAMTMQTSFHPIRKTMEWSRIGANQESNNHIRRRSRRVARQFKNSQYFKQIQGYSFDEHFSATSQELLLEILPTLC